MLRKGQRFIMDGHTWRVLYVNPSRAHCACVDRQTVTIKGRSFLAHSTKTTDLSPDTCVEVLARFDRTQGVSW
jgi:hypothetical protein